MTDFGGGWFFVSPQDLSILILAHAVVNNHRLTAPETAHQLSGSPDIAVSLTMYSCSSLNLQWRLIPLFLSSPALKVIAPESWPWSFRKNPVISYIPFEQSVKWHGLEPLETQEDWYDERLYI